jgi:Tfp pilus assembly protein PilE
MKDFKYFLYLRKLNLICILSNNTTSLCLTILFLSIIPLSFLFSGCNDEDENKVMDEHISRLEKEAESRLIYKIQEQERYFAKHQTFFKPPDEPATRYGSFPPIFGTQKCYRYYTETNAELTSQTKIDAVYSYAIQDDCGGMLGIELRGFAGAVFVLPPTGNKKLKKISIVCRNIKSYASIPSRPKYINGLVKCLSDTKIEYYQSN